jgi:hypothetical protein
MRIRAAAQTDRDAVWNIFHETITGFQIVVAQKTSHLEQPSNVLAGKRLVPPPLMLDSIGEKTLVADRAHVD